MTTKKPGSSSPNATDANEHSTLTAADQLRIRQAMNRMPFSASTRVPIPYDSPVNGRSEPVTVTSIVAFLDGLAEVINEQTAIADNQRRRLNRLDADVEAFRRLIDTAPAEVRP